MQERFKVGLLTIEILTVELQPAVKPQPVERRHVKGIHIVVLFMKSQSSATV